MIDAVGNVSSVLVVGGTSDLGQSVLARLIGPRLRRVVLAGRPSESMDRAANHVRNAGVPEVETIALDATDRTGHRPAIREAFADGDIDVVIMAVGWCPIFDPADPNVNVATRCVETNLTGMVSLGLLVSECLKGQGHGTTVWFTAAAAGVPAHSEAVFAATQAGIDAFAASLAEQHRDEGLRTIIVRVGPIPTKLGYRGPRSIPGADPAAVANAVAVAIRSKQQSVVYVPAQARSAAARLRRMPASLRRRLVGRAADRSKHPSTS